ncbi:leucine-rich repeat domain-containing protein [uncultured Zobellia sp.]|uniref:leucine-rich repeat domain-containing protein n=1 Tax=uncultured Zobellia sp. TaxID=255433 RepID=UPI00259A0B8F|nr:leucine-rich repeat domain-containing protein [uncultured Zobellia sp.]
MKKNYIFLSLLLLFSFFGYAQTNMLKNPSFEESFILASENFDDWSINFNTIRTKVTDATDQTYAVKIQTNRSGSNGFFAQLSAATPSNDLAFESGKTYTISFDYKVATGTISELKATLLRDNFYLEDEQIVTNQTVGGWVTFTYDFTATSTSAHNFDIDMIGTTSTAEIIIDNVNVSEKAASPDRDALIALYNATDGPNWTNTWDLESDINTWYGVTLNNENRVEKLILINNNLTGTLINEIGNLTSLVELNLNYNSLSGEIPSQLFNLQNVSKINLGNNILTGSIPSTIENLSSITNISLSDNDLSGSIPSSIGNLSTLTSLYLTGNDLSGEIPKELGNLSLLKSLGLSSNHFNGEIPDELGNLSDLRSLELSENQLSGTIPETFINLTQITSLSFGYNDLSGEIPEFIWSLGSLSTLSVSSNNFSGQLTSAIANAVNIKWLFLGTNNFSGSLPIEIWSLPSLTILNLEKLNSLEPWSIPNEIQNLTNIGTLNAQNGNIIGELPDAFETLTNLTSLYLNNNNISGQIPGSLGSLPNLKNLHLHTNNLSGVLPEINNEGATISISYNDYVFEDIEDKISSFNDKNVTFNYYPQNNIDIRQEIIIPEGEGFQLTVNDTQSENNTYQWRINEIAIPDATEATLDLSNFSDQDVGLYDCVITNPNVTGLTLYKNPILLATQFYMDNINKISVKSISASCPNEAQGEIVVEFGFPQKYKINLQKENNQIGERISLNGETVSFTNLLAGDDYSITVYSYISDNYNWLRTAGVFNIIVSEPEAFISGKAVVDQTKKTAKLVVSGSKNYEVMINGEVLTYLFDDTGVHELRFDLTNGANSILAKTDKNCQGEYSETVLLNSVRVFPNPSVDEVTILGIKNDEDALISILDMSGVLIKSYSKNLTNESVVIDIANLPEGMYLIQVKSKEQDVQTKIIKR